MDALIVKTSRRSIDDSVHVSPMRYSDVESVLSSHMRMSLNDKNHNIDTKSNSHNACKKVSSLILELPHRELGGKLTPWEDVLSMSSFCNRSGISFHCDGARIFEAATGYNLSIAEVAAPFDSVYVSLYKGIGAITGAVLLGRKDFCDEARVWLNRFGGNLYTLLPYAVSGWSNLRSKTAIDDPSILTFDDKKQKMKRIISLLSSEKSISELVIFDPKIPETSMIHCYFPKSTVAQCEAARDIAEKECGIKVFSRIRATSDKLCRPADQSTNNFDFTSSSYFEWSIGDANGMIPDQEVLRGWKSFVLALHQIKKSS